MKLHPFLMVAVLTTTVLCGSAAAEYQDKMFGNGRFLRRLRDDITGKSDSKTKPKTDAKSEAKAKATEKLNSTRAKASSVLKSISGKTPTLAIRPRSTAAKLAAEESSARTASMRPTPTKSAQAKPTQPRSAQPKSVEPQRARSSSDRQASTTIRSAKKNQNSGFGMLLESKKKNIVVEKIDANGNAAEAGVRRGDLILEAGGVELGSMEEFNEITGILGQGDQLEFEVSRKGKKKTILIQFGTEPENDENIETESSKKENDYSFVPEDVDKPQTGTRSIMSRPNTSQSQQPQANNVRSKAFQVQTNQNDLEQSLIEQQRIQIQQMQREIQRLRQSTTNATASESPLRAGKTILEGPSLSGPGK